MGNTDYAARQTAALPDLAVVARDAETANTPITTPRDAVAAINKRIGDIEDAIRAPLKDKTITYSKPNMLQLIPDYINEALEKKEGAYSNEDVKDAREAMDARVLQIDSIPKLENFRKQLNEELNWDAVHTGPSVRVTIARATAAAIRDQLYGTDSNPGIYERAGLQGDVRGARRRVGNLIEVRDNLDRAINRAEQTGDWSAVSSALSFKGLTTTGAGAAIGAFLCGGIPGAIVGEAATQAHSFLTSKNPNLNTEYAFKHLAESGLPEPKNPTYAPGERIPGTPKSPANPAGDSTPFGPTEPKNKKLKEAVRK